MGQKVHPFAYRLGPLYTWKSRWFADDRTYQEFVLQDSKLRKFLKDRLKLAGINQVEIERSINTTKIILHVARPGVVIGRGGTAIEELKDEIALQLGINKKDPKAPKFEVDVVEVKNAETSSYLVAQRIAEQLVKRYPHRRAVSQALERVMSAGAKGIKIVLSGRIGGAEISRTEKYSEGSVPTQTIRADIDYASYPSLTKFGYTGIKVWIYKGEKETK